MELRVNEVERLRAELQQKSNEVQLLELEVERLRANKAAYEETAVENERLRAQLQAAREQCFTLEPDDPIRAALEEEKVR